MAQNHNQSIAPAAGISKEAFTADFLIKASEVPKIQGRPKYSTLRPLREAVEKNLMAMKDSRDNTHGRLHLIQDVSLLPGGPAAAVPVATDQGQPAPCVAPTSYRERENYLIHYYRDQEQFLSDRNAQEALKDFIFDRMDEVYINRLKHPKLGYKLRTLREIVEALRTDFPAAPEEKAAVEKDLLEPN